MNGIISMIPNREFKLSELSKINSSASEIDAAAKNRYSIDNFIKDTYWQAITFGLLADNVQNSPSQIFKDKEIATSTKWSMTNKSSALSTSAIAYSLNNRITSAKLGVSLNIISGSIPSLKVYIMYYDLALAYISSQNKDALDVIGYQLVTINAVIPTTARYFRVGISTGAVTSASLEHGGWFLTKNVYTTNHLHYSTSDLISIQSRFKDKNKAVLGDSITIATDSWSYYLTKRLGFNNDVNKAISGYTLSSSGSVGSICSQADALISQYSKGDFDVIIISGGTNDYNAQFALGDSALQSSLTLASVDKTTVAGACRYIVQTLSTAFPSAKIILVTPIQRWNNVNTIPLINYANTIKEMAKYLSVECFDAFSEAGILSCFEIENAQGRYLHDGLHPSSEGKIKMGEYFSYSLMQSKA